jgi:hypothetical protein
MMKSSVAGAAKLIGRSPDTLTLQERISFAGKHVALEIYTPGNLALRRIEAVGDSLEECIRTLQDRGLDPRKFEFTLIAPAF